LGLYKNCKTSVKSKKKLIPIKSRVFLEFFFIIILGPNFQNIIGSVNEKYWFSQIQIGKDGFAAQNAG